MKLSTKAILLIIVPTILILILARIFFENKLSDTEEKVYKTEVLDLKDRIQQKINAKKAIGITNALSIANDGRVRKSLSLYSKDSDVKHRKWAIISLKDINSKMKSFTNFKNSKVHIHTKDNHSFIRNWKLDKFGDDLSSFRHSVVKVNQTGKPVNTFEVGKAGLSLRSVVPITNDDGKHLGSLEFMQGMNSVAKAFNKQIK
jgi:methyl-accepting chemotaxis protein